MHENLQKYAVAVQYLMKLDIQTDAVHDNDVRLKRLADLSGNIKSLLCEIEEALNGTCQVLPTRIPPTYPEEHNLSHTVNLTEMRMRDKEVMSKLHSAIINWEKLAKRLARKRGETGKRKNQNKNRKTHDTKKSSQDTKKQHQNKKKSKTKPINT